jgi:hypothetical protein
MTSEKGVGPALPKVPEAQIADAGAGPNML